MAKRVRGSRSTHRPGGQGPSRAKRASDEEMLPADGVSPDADENGIVSAAGEPDAVYAESPPSQSVAAVATAAPATTGSRRARRRSKSRPDDLASRATAETVWVREDLRRIGVVSVILVATLAISWVVFVFLDVLGLY